MVRVATGVETIPCVTALQAEVTELRLIGAHAPRYNRRSKFPERTLWIKITDEAFPRLSVVKDVRDDQATYFGPFRRRQAAEDVLLAIYDSFPIRQCTPRLSPTQADRGLRAGRDGPLLRALRRIDLPRRLRRGGRRRPFGASPATCDRPCPGSRPDWPASSTSSGSRRRRRSGAGWRR